MQKPREIAVRILRRREESATFTEHLLDQELARASLSSADRRLVQELVFGVVRWQLTLDWLMARKTAHSAQKLTLKILARLALYQIFWLQKIPDHAAVHETVQLAKELGFGPQSGFVNALLRGYLREREATRQLLADLKLAEPSLGYSHPDWLIGRWQNRWGAAQARQLLEWNNQPPMTFGRVNRLRTDAQQLTQQWTREGVDWFSSAWDWTGNDLVYRLESYAPLVSLPSFAEGLFYVQDPSTLLAVKELDPQPDERLFDACAAPGGKTTFMAQCIGNRGRIVAHDPNPERLTLLTDNCARLGVTCVQTSSSFPLATGEPKAPFDRALVDVPCSNTGVLRRRIDLRWRLQHKEIDRLRRTQIQILKHAAQSLKRQGILVYSTCSLEPEENRELIKDFLAEHHDYRLENERELIPFVDGVDGAYVARLRRRGVNWGAIPVRAKSTSEQP